MKVVWALDSATVRQVYEELLKHRHIAYTTVMTLMNILEKKGHLKKVIGAMVHDFIHRVFNGSAEPLLLHLIEDQQLTEQDLEEIRQTIRAAKKTPPKGAK